MQAYQDYVSTYHQKTSLYNIMSNDNRTNLLIYITESERKDSKYIETFELLDYGTCITQLPSGKLFCFGKVSQISGITLIIDEDYRVQTLPPGTACWYSSAIYFKNNVYCFGGFNGIILSLSTRFDLGKNQWIQLTSLPKADQYCNSVIFNGSILISGYSNKNLLDI